MSPRNTRTDTNSKTGTPDGYQSIMVECSEKLVEHLKGHIVLLKALDNFFCDPAAQFCGAILAGMAEQGERVRMNLPEEHPK